MAFVVHLAPLQIGPWFGNEELCLKEQINNASSSPHKNEASNVHPCMELNELYKSKFACRKFSCSHIIERELAELGKATERATSFCAQRGRCRRVMPRFEHWANLKKVTQAGNEETRRPTSK